MLRRVALIRRTPFKAKRRPPYPSVLHDYILRRDKECVAAKLGFVHECRSTFGVPHAPFALPLLTVEEIKDDDKHAMGQKAPRDAKHGVALCGLMNTRPPSREMRQAFRAYLADVES
jgi:hypothetical protein